jgi:hypothetical protein
MLTDSSDGLNWRTTMLSTADACAQGSNPVPAGGTLYVSWVQSIPAGCTNFNVTAANAMMATFDVASGSVTNRTVIAPINGSGDKIVACNNPADLREVIETAPGHDARNFELPTTTIDANGVLYAAWNDRPAGVGGGNNNATRIFLSVSRDGNQTWSAPQVISGRVSRQVMSDRFQPWITIDGSGLHAMWYQRVAGDPADLIQADKEDLSLATASTDPQPGAETAISSVAFPIVQTNPQQDPVISFCYMATTTTSAPTGRPGSSPGAITATWSRRRPGLKTSRTSSCGAIKAVDGGRERFLPASSFTDLDKSLTCLGALGILTAPGWEGTGQATPRGVAWLYAPPAQLRDARMHYPREEDKP